MITDHNTRTHRQIKKDKIVMAFGTFDYFHAGHEFYLTQAKSHGDKLIVVVARDKTVKQIKTRQPVKTEKQRVKDVKASNIADKVILGDKHDKHKAIRTYRPNVIALGYDQMVFTQTLKKTIIDLGLDTIIVRIAPHFPHVFKSSIIKNAQKVA